MHCPWDTHGELQCASRFCKNRQLNVPQPLRRHSPHANPLACKNRSALKVQQRRVQNSHLTSALFTPLRDKFSLVKWARIRISAKTRLSPRAEYSPFQITFFLSNIRTIKDKRREPFGVVYGCCCCTSFEKESRIRV